MVCVLRRNHPHSPLSKRKGSREARSGWPPTNGAAGSGRRRRWNVGRPHRCRSPAPWAGPRGLFRSTPPPHVRGLRAGRRVAGMETPSRAGTAASRTDESPTGWSSRWSRILPGRNQPAVRATASRPSEEYGLPVPAASRAAVASSRPRTARTSSAQVRSRACAAPTVKEPPAARVLVSRASRNATL